MCLVTTGSGMSTAKRKSILVSFYKSIVGTVFPHQELTTSSQGTVHELLNYICKQFAQAEYLVLLVCQSLRPSSFNHYMYKYCNPDKMYAFPYTVLELDFFSFCLIHLWITGPSWSIKSRRKNLAWKLCRGVQIRKGEGSISAGGYLLGGPNRWLKRLLVCHTRFKQLTMLRAG